MAHYTLVPNLSAYVQFNRGHPRDQLGLIYMIGGAFVFVAARLAGWLSDRHGAPPIALFGTTLYSGRRRVTGPAGRARPAPASAVRISCSAPATHFSPMRSNTVARPLR